jgi:hypothetical protein
MDTIHWIHKNSDQSLTMVFNMPSLELNELEVFFERDFKLSLDASYDEFCDQPEINNPEIYGFYHNQSANPNVYRYTLNYIRRRIMPIRY